MGNIEKLRSKLEKLKTKFPEAFEEIKKDDLNEKDGDDSGPSEIEKARSDYEELIKTTNKLGIKSREFDEKHYEYQMKVLGEKVDEAEAKIAEARVNTDNEKEEMKEMESELDKYLR